MGRDDAEEAAILAVALAARVMQQPFFALRKLPGDWQQGIRKLLIRLVELAGIEPATS